MTAEIFNEVLNCRLVEIEELQEFSLGPHEGRIKGKWFQDWRSGLELSGAESYVNFIGRCLVGINKALELPGLVLIIAHGGVYWAIEQVIQASIEGGLQNCIPVFYKPPTDESKKWEISTFNLPES
jgi:broad specificity phosphatase PhoE